MYYIGIKQSGFNALNILSENSAHWLTFFNPDSKLKIQCKTATTIKLDGPIMANGQSGTMFQYGAPIGHLNNYRRI